MPLTRVAIRQIGLRTGRPARIVCAVLLLALGNEWTLQGAPPRVRRAKRPMFPPEVAEKFFPDAREKLVGPRPQNPAGAGSSPANEPATPVATMPALGWSDVIAAEAVEDEIKARQTRLARAVENATSFRSGEYQQAQRELGVLAAMLAIVAQYDGEIRWKNSAAGLRDLVARAGFNCKTANDATYQEALSRSQDLQSLVRGGSLTLPTAEARVDWPRVSDRTLLMKRLDEAEKQSLGPDLASADAFVDGSERLLHEAQLVAALAKVIAQPGYEFADDPSYVEFAEGMRQQALLLRSAVHEGNYEEARKAAGELRQSCTNCHEGYRS